jgi:hypothetical protein
MKPATAVALEIAVGFTSHAMRAGIITKSPLSAISSSSSARAGSPAGGASR